MKLNANNRGLAAEQLAETYLIKQGLNVVARNYHCRYGEVDLIMQASNTLVFVEVRMRKNYAFGSAAESITPAKQQKLIRAAQHYLQVQGEQACRFDAVLLNGNDLESIEWIENAFGL